MSKFFVHTSLDSDEMVDSLVTGVSEDALFEFIVALDDRVCDLDFTHRLAAHFAKVVADEEAAEAKVQQS